METQDSNPIPRWAEEDRPREKLILKGKGALSDAELIAILIGSGSRNESAVELARRILRSVNDDLVELSRLTVRDLSNFKGMGEAKVVSILAALELGRRRRGAEVVKKQKVNNSRDAFEYFQKRLSDLNYEAFYILLLNKANKILRDVCISEGGFSATVADPKKIFKTALDHSASYIVLCHNHPSGNIQPSHEDINLTRKLRLAGEQLELRVVDHIIMGEENYYSFADEGVLDA
jgi:DNA repair protein RadC